MPVENASAVTVEKINYVDITGTSATERAVAFSCSDAAPCRRLLLTGVNLTRVGGGNASAYCHQVFGKNVGDVVPESCLGKEDFIRQVPSTGTPRRDAEEEEADADDADNDDEDEDADWSKKFRARVD